VGTPEKLFEMDRLRAPDDARPEVDIRSDGQRFLVLQFVEQEKRFQKIEVIHSLPELLRRRAPAR